MRSKKILFVLLITSMLILPFINFATAASTPGYVGIEEGDEFIWDVSIDDNQWEDFLEDDGFSETFIDNYMDEVFEDELDDDIIGWKITILKLEDEDEVDDEKFVKYKFGLDTKEEDEDWEVEDYKDNNDIWKYDKDVYTEMMHGAVILTALSIISRELIPFVVADNVKWGKIANGVDDELDDDFDGNDESAGAEVTTSLYFFMQKENGISVFINFDEDDLEDITIIAQFNDNGILMYYNLAYDDDTVIELVLHGIQGRTVTEWWWTAVAISVAAVVIVIVIIVIKKR